MRCLQTFAGKCVSRGGFFEVIDLATTGPPPDEVPHGEGQDGDTSDTTNYTASNCTDRSRGNATWRHGGRGHAACGTARTTSTYNGGDVEIIDNERMGLVGRRDRNVNLVSTVCQFWCPEVGDRFVGVTAWLLGAGCDGALSEWLTT
jgi:hypothetical protein